MEKDIELCQKNVDQIISCIHFVDLWRAFDNVDISHVYCEPVCMT